LNESRTQFVEDLIADGVVYGEVRWAPELHLENGLDMRDAIDAVQSGIDSAITAGRADGRVIRIGQLLCAMRQNDRADEVADLAIEYRGRGVVGFDIAGPEAGFPVSRLACCVRRSWTRRGFPERCTPGEADGLLSIEGALIDGRALRLGHGVRITDDLSIEIDGAATHVTLGPLAEWVRDRQIALEICPTSNVHTNAFSRFGSTIDVHPFEMLYQLGFAVTVNTDNRLMSGTSLSREIANLAETFGYDLDDVLQVATECRQCLFYPE